jgi:tetratricopeptide (TPR) repeat protein
MNMEKKTRIVHGMILLFLLAGFLVLRSPAVQAQDEPAAAADTFLEAVRRGDSPGAYELCSSGVRRGKTAENFLESPEISSIFSGMTSWETIGVSGKGSIKTVLVKLTNAEGAQRMLGMATLKMRGSYRVRDFSTTPWTTSKARALRYLSDLYARLDDLDAAYETIQKAYAMDPNDPKVSAFLGYIYIEKETKLEEARQLIAAAHEKMPAEPEFMDFMGWYYHKVNNRQESVKWFDMAREAFQKQAGYRTSPEYIRFSNHVSKAKATGWRPTQT